MSRYPTPESGPYCDLDTSALKSGRAVVRTLFLDKRARDGPTILRAKVLVRWWVVVATMSVRVRTLIVCRGSWCSLRVWATERIVSLAISRLRHHLDVSDQGTIPADA